MTYSPLIEHFAVIQNGKGYWLKRSAMRYIALYLSFMLSFLCRIYRVAHSPRVKVPEQSY